MNLIDLYYLFREVNKLFLTSKFNTKQEVVALVKLQQCAWQLHLFVKYLVIFWTWHSLHRVVLV